MPSFRFLIAEPNPALQTFARQQLEQYGFDAVSIQTVSTPRAGRVAAEDLKPDFLLADTFTKEAMSGLGLHHAVLQHNPNCSLALWGANPSDVDREEATQAGVLFLLAKPFTVRQFQDALLSALTQLASKHPLIAQHMDQHAKQLQATTHVIPPNIVLSPVSQYKSGDQVSYLNRRETVKDVIVRRGELVVYLHGITGMVEASKLHRL